jgi:hypothetical protein
MPRSVVLLAAVLLSASSAAKAEEAVRRSPFGTMK